VEVTKSDRAVAFYRGALGAQGIFSSADWSRLQPADRAEERIRLAEAQDTEGSSFSLAEPA
jgi:hypothetical protein